MIRPFCCIKFWWGVYLPGALYRWKNMKKRVEIVLKLATNGQSDKGFLLTSTFVPKGLSAPTLGLYTCIKALKYIPGPGVRWAFTGPLVLWLWRNMQNYPVFIAKYHPYLFFCLVATKMAAMPVYVKTEWPISLKIEIFQKWASSWENLSSWFATQTGLRRCRS